MYPEIMLDVETYAVFDHLPPGQRPELLEIAGVKFDDSGILDEFRAFPSTGNGAADPWTVDWWNGQILDRIFPSKFDPPDWLPARRVKDTVPMVLALNRLAEWMGVSSSRKVWCMSRYGLQFDLEALRMHFSAHGLTTPWWRECQRDMKPLLEDRERPAALCNPSHNAIYDARAQVEALLEIRQEDSLVEKNIILNAARVGKSMTHFQRSKALLKSNAERSDRPIKDSSET